MESLLFCDVTLRDYKEHSTRVSETFLTLVQENSCKQRYEKWHWTTTDGEYDMAEIIDVAGELPCVDEDRIISRP